MQGRHAQKDGPAHFPRPFQGIPSHGPALTAILTHLKLLDGDTRIRSTRLQHSLADARPALHRERSGRKNTWSGAFGCTMIVPDSSWASFQSPGYRCKPSPQTFRFPENLWMARNTRIFQVTILFHHWAWTGTAVISFTRTTSVSSVLRILRAL